LSALGPDGGDLLMHDGSSLHDYVAALRRRKWLVLLALVIVPAVAIALSLLQTPRYQASAEVLLSRQNLAALLNNSNDQSLAGDPARLAQTQADLAQVPEVARRTTARAGIKNMTPAEFLATSAVSVKKGADLLVFTVWNRHPSIAERLATLYGRAYIDYRGELDTAALTRARREVLDRIGALESGGDRRSPLHASLVDKEQQLATMEALQTSNASLIKPAQGASQTQPRPARNGALALGLGLLLGIGLAFLIEALDTRVRTADSVARRLGLPILAQIPQPPRALRASGRLAIVDEPESIYAEPYRILRTNLDLANVERKAKTIMVTSAVEGEGKSTTVANLAVAAARAGREVILVDLDFRHPYLRTLFPDVGADGLTDVALGRVTLGEALIPVLLDEEQASGPGGSSTGNGASRCHTMLRVLPAGTLPPNPGEFIGSDSVGQVLADLAARADLVLIDSAPMLGIGDALTLASKVDALLLVTRLNLVRRPMLRELERALTHCQAKPLGVVVTGAATTAAYGYAYGYEHVRADQQTRVEARRPAREESELWS
jgi:Mrp family chromosome partitioning ATPase